MIVVGLIAIVFVVLGVFLLILIADSLPAPFQKYFGYFFIFVSSVELLLLIWVVIYAASSDWTLLSLTIDAFWKEQLTPIYFIKEWLYSRFWNDFLNIFFVFLPAVVFLTLRTALTTYIGFRALAASKRQG
jgi:hypothetical protein